jgi:xanthine/CO dehydrogenase XdhC/CoxF family maturation factor
MEWVKAIQSLRTARRAGVLVTVTAVRGHAPRAAGAKMVVALDNVWATVGGGNLEALAIERARQMIADDMQTPEVLTTALSDKAPYQHGVQCCGGEVTMLLEPLPVLPELVVGELPAGTHAVIMTHDHAEDAALCDAAIRNEHLATIGLIGSRAKWARFQRKLAEDGNSAESIARITTPIGIPGITGKEPAVIAVSVAAWLLELFIAERRPAPAHREANA